jgi:hypothetical protein
MEAGAAQWLSVGLQSRRSAVRISARERENFFSFFDEISIHGMA